MTDARSGTGTASHALTAAAEAARVMSRARWGTSRLDKLVDELVSRVDEIGPDNRERLRVLVEHDENQENR